MYFNRLNIPFKSTKEFSMTTLLLDSLFKPHAYVSAWAIKYLHKQMLNLQYGRNQGPCISNHPTENLYASKH